MSKDKQKSEPESPPEIRRRVRFKKYQIVGLPFLFAIPVLASFGVFDSSRAMASASNKDISLEVAYYDRLRDDAPEPITIVAKNSSQSPLSQLKVQLERSCVGGQKKPQMRPEPNEIDERFVTFVFDNVPPGESRIVEIDAEVGLAGTHEGQIQASAGGEPVSVRIKTFAFP